MKPAIYEFTLKDINGNDRTMAEFEGKVLLIVNTASKCGFTSQYAGLQKLYEKYHSAGLEILGFPCNQFGGQEPEKEDNIVKFCQVNYGVSFPMFAKIEVNGTGAAPLFEYLKKEAPGFLGSIGIKWNFTKFLVDRQGKVVRRFGSTTTPDKIEPLLKKLLVDSAVKD